MPDRQNVLFLLSDEHNHRFLSARDQKEGGETSTRKIATPVSLADLFPTICGLTEKPLGEDLDGLDLSPAIWGESVPALEDRPGVISESLSPRWGEGAEFRMIRSDRYKYIAFRGCDDLAFDIVNDRTNRPTWLEIRRERLLINSKTFTRK